MFGPNVDLDVQPAFAHIPLGNSTNEAKSNTMMQKLKEECPPPVHETLARILLHHPVDLRTITAALDDFDFLNDS